MYNTQVHSEKQQEFLYVPEDFDPKKFPGIIADKPDSALGYLNCYHYQRVIRNYDRETFVPLHSEILALMVGDREYVRPIREALGKYHILDCDYSYVKGSKSYGHKIGRRFANAKWHRYFPTNKRTIKRLHGFRQAMKNRQYLPMPVNRYLAEWMKQVVWLPGYETALQNVLAVKPLAENQVELINSGHIYNTVCQYGRHHSNYTGLVRELRKFLAVKVDNQLEKLWEIDVVSSQPYHLALLLAEIAYNNKNFRNWDEITINDPTFITSIIQSHNFWQLQEGNSNKQYQQSFPLPICLQFLDEKSDLIQLCNDVINSQLYEKWGEAIKATSREDAKDRFFHIVYGKIWTMKTSKDGKVLRDLYPGVWETILDLKEAKGKNWVACEMQRREAKVIIHRACTDLMDNYPNIPILTVHDSILTTREHLDTVERVLKDAHQCQLFSPNFRRER